VWRGSLIDPESLLLITCTVGRYDARMFDAMVEWMGINGRYINVQRLKRIMASEQFAGEQVVRAVAAMTRDSVSAAKWSGTAKPGEVKPGEAEAPPCPLFFLSNGKPMPVQQEPDPIFCAHGLLRTRYETRNVAQLFRPEPVCNLLLRLRAFLGVNARCEIIAYLLLHEKGSPGPLARDAYYFPLTISKAMAEMRVAWQARLGEAEQQLAEVRAAEQRGARAACVARLRVPHWVPWRVVTGVGAIAAESTRQ
jgi:hypothetical protein